MTGVSGYFERGAGEFEREHMVRFRDTDPRPLVEPRPIVDPSSIEGRYPNDLEALIPTKPRNPYDEPGMMIRPVAIRDVDDERIVDSLAAFLVDLGDVIAPGLSSARVAEAIRLWSDGAR